MTKRKYRKIVLLISLLLFLFILFQVIKVQDEVLKIIYKTKYLLYIETYSEEYNVDKYLVLSIIKNESNFKKEAVSSKSAKGLMQIVDSTAEEVAKKINIQEYKDESLYEEKTNIQIGTKYIAELIEKYEGNHILAVSAYNAGIGKVDKWIEDEVIKQDGSDIENIPYKETNNYVRKVLRDYEIYKYLYEEK